MTRDVVTVEASSRSNGDSNLTCGEDPSFWFNWLFGSLWFHSESLDQFGKNYDNLIHLGSFEQFGLFGEFAFILVSYDSIFYSWSTL
jgi:hypothetical protein